MLSKIPWRCAVIDEAHRLKNRNCKLLEGLNKLQLEHRVLLTGTPLQNNVEELFSLLNFLEPTRFPSQAAFLVEFGKLETEAQVDRLQQVCNYLTCALHLHLLFIIICHWSCIPKNILRCEEADWFACD